MFTQFAHDLRTARRKSGLSQIDLSILLDVGEKEVIDIERGRREPSLKQTCKLSLIYGRSFTSLYDMVSKAAKKALFQQLPSLPAQSSKHVSRLNRSHTLKRLEKHLADELKSEHGAT